MQFTDYGQTIFVSGRTWHEVFPKTIVTPFIDVLREGIDLTRYGDGLKEYYFSFIIMKPDDFFKPYKYFSRKKRAADIAVQIPYAKVEHATQAETIRLMEAAYLEGIDKLATIRFDAPFDVAAFKKDVAAIFADPHWYEPILQAFHDAQQRRLAQ